MLLDELAKSCAENFRFTIQVLLMPFDDMVLHSPPSVVVPVDQWDEIVQKEQYGIESGDGK